MEKCYLCHSRDLLRRHTACRDRKDVYPMECNACGLVFLSSFDHITAQFYEKSGMHQPLPVISLVVDQQARRDIARRFLENQVLITGKTILDFGCGDGSWLEKAASVAQNAFGIEPELAMHPFHIERGLQVFPSLEVVDSELKFDVITLFHVMEHLPDPLETLERLRPRLKSNGLIIVEVPNASDALLTLYENKAFCDFSYWSCHLFLFTESTLTTLMSRAGYALVDLQQVQRYPLTNHLHWLAKGRPGGGGEGSTPELEHAYAKWLAQQHRCDTLLGLFRNTDRI